MVKKTENIIVGISVGDLNGIGSEIILKTFEDNRMLEDVTPVIFASVKVMSFAKKTFETTAQLHGIDNIDQIVHGKINVLNVWRENLDVNFGKLDGELGKFAIKSFTTAVDALKNGDIDVLVTAPINKFAVQSDEFRFPGHTDYLAAELDGDALMFMINDSLRVGLLTDHVPVNEIAGKLTEMLIFKKVLTVEKSLIKDFSIHRPTIAVLGLNPHAGDNGVIGQEDEKLLKPAIKKLFDKGTLVFGPFPADGFFGSGQYKKYDGIIAAYHDQGLVPFKTLSFGHGVNFTAGLDFIRTSPDHGTALDIAGKGIANSNSFREAIHLATDAFFARQQYKQISHDLMKVRPKQEERGYR